MPLCAAFAPALAKGSCQESCWSHKRSRTTYCTVRLKTAVLHLLLYCLLCCTLLPFNFYPYVSGLRIPSLNPPAYTSQAFYLFISISSIPPPQLLKKKKTYPSIHCMIHFRPAFYSVSIMRWAKLNSFRADVRPLNSVRTTEKFHNYISFCSAPFYFISAWLLSCCNRTWKGLREPGWVMPASFFLSSYS